MAIASHHHEVEQETVEAAMLKQPMQSPVLVLALAEKAWNNT